MENFPSLLFWVALGLPLGNRKERRKHRRRAETFCHVWTNTHNRKVAVVIHCCCLSVKIINSRFCNQVTIRNLRPIMRGERTTTDAMLGSSHITYFCINFMANDVDLFCRKWWERTRGTFAKLGKDRRVGRLIYANGLRARQEPETQFSKYTLLVGCNKWKTQHLLLSL